MRTSNNVCGSSIARRRRSTGGDGAAEEVRRPGPERAAAGNGEAAVTPVLGPLDRFSSTAT